MPNDLAKILCLQTPGGKTVPNTYSFRDDDSGFAKGNKDNTAWRKAEHLVLLKFPQAGIDKFFKIIKDHVKDEKAEKLCPQKVYVQEKADSEKFICYDINGKELKGPSLLYDLLPLNGYPEIEEFARTGFMILNNEHKLTDNDVTFLNSEQTRKDLYIDNIPVLREKITGEKEEIQINGNNRFYTDFELNIGDKTYYLTKELHEEGYGKIIEWFIKKDKTIIHKILEQRGNLNGEAEQSHENFLAAIRTKPFVLLAGISGTGKTRLVRQLAQRFWGKDSTEGNYECIPVRPNWHDSTELLGYVSRASGKSEYQITNFLRFLAKAWLYEAEGIPFFLCLDEMNLAPVEQYFAEYLSVIESRKKEGEKIVTRPLVVVATEEVQDDLLDRLFKKYETEKADQVKTLKDYFKKVGGIPIPSNLVVMGTVNMDETTCSFSRKVLDRAMTFELNEVDLRNSGLEESLDPQSGDLNPEDGKCTYCNGYEVYNSGEKNKEICGSVIDLLEKLNSDCLGNTPFKLAYRTRDEMMIYCVERLRGETLPTDVTTTENESAPQANDGGQDTPVTENSETANNAAATPGNDGDTQATAEATPQQTDSNVQEEPQEDVSDAQANENDLTAPQTQSAGNTELSDSLKRALDEAVSMKVLCRIEGDEQIVNNDLLKTLKDTISSTVGDGICTAKLDEMISRLKNTHYTSFWS